jgi:hypothetical protein
MTRSKRLSHITPSGDAEHHRVIALSETTVERLAIRRMSDEIAHLDWLTVRQRDPR